MRLCLYRRHNANGPSCRVISPRRWVKKMVYLDDKTLPWLTRMHAEWVTRVVFCCTRLINQFFRCGFGIESKKHRVTYIYTTQDIEILRPVFSFLFLFPFLFFSLRFLEFRGFNYVAVFFCELCRMSRYKLDRCFDFYKLSERFSSYYGGPR